jgi:hypothetical protein
MQRESNSLGTRRVQRCRGISKRKKKPLASLSLCMALSFAAIIQSLQCLKLIKRLVITIFRRLLQQRTFHKCMQRGPVILLTLDVKTKSTLRNIVCRGDGGRRAAGCILTPARMHFSPAPWPVAIFYSLWRVDIMRILSLIIMVINTSPERRM